jgi:hypothetical protein
MIVGIPCWKCFIKPKGVIHSVDECLPGRVVLDITGVDQRTKEPENRVEEMREVVFDGEVREHDDDGLIAAAAGL